MIIDVTTQPKGIVLIRVPDKGPTPSFTIRPEDKIAFAALGRTDARTWRPDVTTAQNWQRSTSAAEAPLPADQAVTYTTRRQPRTVSYTCLLTDHVLEAPGASGYTGIRRSFDLLAGLQQWQQDRAIVAVVSPIEIIETAYISEMSVPRTPEDGNSIVVNLTLREIRTYQLARLASIDDVANQFGASRTRTGGVVIG